MTDFVHELKRALGGLLKDAKDAAWDQNLIVVHKSDVQQLCEALDVKLPPMLGGQEETK